MILCKMAIFLKKLDKIIRKADIKCSDDLAILLKQARLMVCVYYRFRLLESQGVI